MPYEELAAQPRSHNISLRDRHSLSLDGVEDVAGFDENTVVLTTSLGELSIRGEGLHIERIDLELGQLELQGKVCELSYDELPAHGSFWNRLFG